MAAITLILAFVFEGMSQGMKNWLANNKSPILFKKRKIYQKTWHAANVLFILMIMLYMRFVTLKFMPDMYCNIDFWHKTGVILAYAIIARWVIFDYVHNFYFGVNMFYKGTTSVTDRLYIRISKFFPPIALFFLKAFALAVLIFDMTK